MIDFSERGLGTRLGSTTLDIFTLTSTLILLPAAAASSNCASLPMVRSSLDGTLCNALRINLHFIAQILIGHAFCNYVKVFPLNHG